MATVATRRENKTKCFTETKKNRLDSDRPSHGRPFHSNPPMRVVNERNRGVKQPSRGDRLAYALCVRWLIRKFPFALHKDRDTDRGRLRSESSETLDSTVDQPRMGGTSNSP